jgi:hypothetical protein
MWGWRSYLWLVINGLDVIVTLCSSYAYLSMGVPFSMVAEHSLRNCELNPVINLLALSPPSFVVFKIVGSVAVLMALYATRRVLNVNRMLTMLNYPMIIVVFTGLISLMMNHE